MAHNWPTIMAHQAAGILRAMARESHPEDDGDGQNADARRMRIELDAIRARFPDRT